MTHFTTLVLTNPGQSPEALLAPFEESPSHPIPGPYWVFEDETENYRKQWETGSATQVRLEDGSFVWTWDDRFRKRDALGWLGSSKTHEIPAHLEQVERSFQDIYGTFERFVAEWAGLQEYEGRYGTWGNPSAKWDWYALGGRWAGVFHAEQHDIFPLKEWNGRAPRAILTPDGEWHSRGAARWFGLFADDQDEAAWAEAARALLATYPDAVAHNYDLHI